MKCERSIAVFLFLSAILQSSNLDAKTRTWQDSRGRTIEAEWVGFSDGKRVVHLRLENGNEIQYPVSRLSQADRDFLQTVSPITTKDSAQQIDAVLTKSFSTPSNDVEFLEKAYLKLAGRQPSPAERIQFDSDLSPDKKGALTDRLIDSDEFPAHFIREFSRLFRLSPPQSGDIPYPNCESEKGQTILAERKKTLSDSPYHDNYQAWLEDQIRINRPWDELVKDLIIATGSYSESPVAGYLASHERTIPFNVSHTFTAFMGVEITCAECHDHPHEEVYRMDFLKLAAFFSELEITVSGDDLNHLLTDNDRLFLSAPDDYQYDDGEPGMSLSPATYFGMTVDLDRYPNQRAAFAAWLTDESNPRFTTNLANRLWEHLFDQGYIEPVNNIPGHLKSVNRALLDTMTELVWQEDFRVKHILKAFCRTKAFQGP